MAVVRLAVRPIVTVRPSFALTRVRSCVSAQVIAIGGWNRPSGRSSTPSAFPEIPTYSSTMS